MELSGQLHASASLALGEESSVHIGYEAEWVPDPMWTLYNREKFLFLARN
jgi:hypothetical protein